MALLACDQSALDAGDGRMSHVFLLDVSQGGAPAIVDNPRMVARTVDFTAVLQTLEDRNRPRVVPAKNDLSVVELNALGNQTRAADLRDILDSI
jgi:hypothetical protein